MIRRRSWRRIAAAIAAGLRELRHAFGRALVRLAKARRHRAAVRAAIRRKSGAVIVNQTTGAAMHVETTAVYIDGHRVEPDTAAIARYRRPA